MKCINENLKTILYKIAGEKYKDLVTINIEWQNIVGAFLSERSKIIKYERNILYIRAINHVWLADFHLKKTEYLQKLKQNTKINIENIFFTI